MADKPKRGLTPEQHAEARESFFRGEAVRAIARRMGLRYATLIAMRDRERWTVSPSVSVPAPGTPAAAEMHRRAQSNVISMSSRRAVERAEQDGTIEAMAKELKNGLLLHAELEVMALAFAKDTINKATAGKLRPGTHTSEAGERKDALAVVEAAIKLSREIAGKRSGTPSISAGVEDDSTRIVWEDTDSVTA